MRLKRKNTHRHLLPVLVVLTAFLAGSYALGNTRPIKIPKADRDTWLAKSKLFHDYALKLSELGIQLTESGEDNQVHQDIAECIVDISIAAFLLETVYTLNANCSQTYLTIRDFYLQIMKALGHTTALTDYNEGKIEELCKKTKDADFLHLIDEGRAIIKELQKTVDEQKRSLLSKLRTIKREVN